MNTTISKITLYVGRWSKTDYVYALNSEDAVAAVKRHFAYGNPSEDTYAVGQEWAAEGSDSGWRIVTSEIYAPNIKVEVKLGREDDIGHVIWTCPFCGEASSDEWRSDDRLPVLLMCGCNEQSRFLLGVR